MNNIIGRHSMKYQDGKETLLNKGSKGVKVVAMGPPFTSGKPHLGTIYNTILKNLFISAFILEGYSVKHQLAFDNHGASIEKKISSIEDGEAFILDNQKDFIDVYHSLKLLYSGNLEVCYTDSPSYRSFVVQLMLDLYNRGIIKEDVLMIRYCPIGGVVPLADQIERKESVRCIYWLYPIGNNYYALNFTTQVYSAAKTAAQAINRNIRYCIYNYKEGKKVVAREHLNMSEFVFDSYLEDFSPFIFSDKVEDAETGILNVLPLYSEIDWEIGVTHNLKTEKLEIGEDLVAFEQALLEQMKREGRFVGQKYIDKINIYNNRTAKLTVPMMSKQIFFDISQVDVDTYLSQAHIHSYEQRLTQTIKNRKYWCISRQRSFGTAIPFNHLSKDKETYLREIQNFLNSDMRNWSTIHGCDIHNIFDCWFESSSLPLYQNNTYDVVIEGHDQCTGWFNSGFILSSAFNKIFSKNVYTHGYVCSRPGVKISKSDGNYITLSQFDKPVDVLYILFSSYSTLKDVVLSNESIDSAYIKYKTIVAVLQEAIDYNAPENPKVCIYFRSHLNYLISKIIQAVKDKRFSIAFENFYRCILEWKSLYKSSNNIAEFLRILPFVLLFLPNFFWENNLQDIDLNIDNISTNIDIDIVKYLQQRIANKELNEYYNILSRLKSADKRLD